ncbi:MAG: hemolysin III family protein [Caldilineaceae bacterium]|nr:hemolysin III family protein [Caldilineaceae bacterium]MCB9137840.1 hemolysin III family protein [Caldilineaceae bacterium]
MNALHFIPRDRNQSLGEEIANAVTHGIGAALSVAGLTLLIVMAVLRGDGWRLAGSIVFGVTLVFLYLASTLYHAIQTERAKRFFHRLDHVGIAFLIAGTYTPILLVKMRTTAGLTVFGIIWALAVAAAVGKIFFMARFRILSTLVYVGMGWIAVFIIVPLAHAMGWGGMMWLIAGGIAYCLGIIPFLWTTIPYHHTIWHLFVMAGSILHYLGIYFHVLPVIH